MQNVAKRPNGSSPPKLGGVAAPQRKCREASLAGADGVVLFRNHPQTGWFSSGTTRRRGGSLQEPPADGVVLFRNHPQTGWFSSGTTRRRGGSLQEPPRRG